MWSLDVELNGDSEYKAEQNSCLLGTGAGQNGRAQGATKAQNGQEAAPYTTPLKGYRFILYRV